MSTPSKPKILVIREQNGVLVGKDENGIEWVIRWCGNGPYSHWVLNLVTNPDVGWYVYKYPENNEKELKDTIQAAEHRYKIY